jgi:hypothetical protein
MRQQSAKGQWWIEKPLKYTGRFGYGRKNIIRISYQNVHHFSASCALCNCLRFIENKKYI